MDINEIRSRIDALDDKLLEAFIERMQLAEQAAEYKLENGLPLEDSQREQAILQKVQERVRGMLREDSGEYEPFAREFFSTLIRLSKERQLEVSGGQLS